MVAVHLLGRTSVPRSELERLLATLPYLARRLNELDQADVPEFEITRNALSYHEFALTARLPTGGNVEVELDRPDAPRALRLRSVTPNGPQRLLRGDGELTLEAGLPIRFQANSRLPVARGRFRHPRVAARWHAYLKSEGAEAHLDLEFDGHLRGWLRPVGAVLGLVSRPALNRILDRAVAQLPGEIERIANLAGPAATPDELAAALIEELARTARPAAG